MTEVRAKLNYLRIAPRKVRLVANLIKGMSAVHAVAELKVLQKKSASPIAKLLQSALANAKKAEVADSALYVREVTVNPGPVLKRFRARAMGRAARIRHRTSHVALVLGVKDEKAR